MIGEGRRERGKGPKMIENGERERERVKGEEANDQPNFWPIPLEFSGSAASHPNGPTQRTPSVPPLMTTTTPKNKRYAHVKRWEERLGPGTGREDQGMLMIPVLISPD